MLEFQETKVMISCMPIKRSNNYGYFGPVPLGLSILEYKIICLFHYQMFTNSSIVKYYKIINWGIELGFFYHLQHFLKVYFRKTLFSEIELQMRFLILTQ